MKKFLGLALLFSVMLMAIPTVLACPPGFSPGYWKGRCLQYLKGKIIDQDLPALIANMPGVYSTWDVQDFYDAFKTGNNSGGYWTFLANLFNTAAGYLPYVED